MVSRGAAHCMYNPFQLLCNASTWVPVSTTVHFWRFCIKDRKKLSFRSLSSGGLGFVSTRHFQKHKWLLGFEKSNLVARFNVNDIYIIFNTFHQSQSVKNLYPLLGNLTLRNLTLNIISQDFSGLGAISLKILSANISSWGIFEPAKILSWAIRKVLSG